MWPVADAEGHFAAPHTHTGTVLHQVYEEFGIQTTIVQGKNTYTQDRTTVRDARFKSKYCDKLGFRVGSCWAARTRTGLDSSHERPEA